MTVGKIYAGLLIVENWRAFKLAQQTGIVVYFINDIDTCQKDNMIMIIIIMMLIICIIIKYIYINLKKIIYIYNL